MTKPTVLEKERVGSVAPLPHKYDVTLRMDVDGTGLLHAGDQPTIVGGPPPQFGGRPEWWSPEHLLLSAVSLCLMTTFQAFVRKRQLDLFAYTSRVRGILEKTPDGIVFTSIVIDVDLKTVPERLEDAVHLLEEAKRYCIVSHALRTPVDLRITTHPV